VSGCAQIVHNFVVQEAFPQALGVIFLQLFLHIQNTLVGLIRVGLTNVFWLCKNCAKELENNHFSNCKPHSCTVVKRIMTQNCD